jgi:dihydrofolate synthase / folylpolyglutamate synthase
MQIIPIKTNLFKEKDNLIDFVLTNIPKLEEGDMVAVTSKIVALSQGQTAGVTDKEKEIRKVSKKVIETPWALMTLTNDGWCINAGVDESNANHKLVLLPKDVFKTAESIRIKLAKYFKLKKVGVLITDTKSLPLRMGTIGRAFGYAGFEPLKSYIGKKDLFGKKSRFTKSNVADALAASAVLHMGEGDEGVPMVIIKEAPVKFSNKKGVSLAILPEKDIYSYIYRNNKK